MTSAADRPRFLIGLDIDGTTTTHEGELREPVRQAVQDVRDAGHHIVIATGRAIVGTLPIL
ncbi:MAG: HAD hydrolase family protein, partial [Tetrasphaera sp.]|nr:HAD hydrolase family protein [Tetrasphaera sp.]